MISIHVTFRWTNTERYRVDSLSNTQESERILQDFPQSASIFEWNVSRSFIAHSSNSLSSDEDEENLVS